MAQTPQDTTTTGSDQAAPERPTPEANRGNAARTGEGTVARFDNLIGGQRRGSVRREHDAARAGDRGIGIQRRCPATAHCLVRRSG